MDLSLAQIHRPIVFASTSAMVSCAPHKGNTLDYWFRFANVLGRCKIKLDSKNLPKQVFTWDQGAGEWCAFSRPIFEASRPLVAARAPTYALFVKNQFNAPWWDKISGGLIEQSDYALEEFTILEKDAKAFGGYP
jgi:hypothetical protein